MHSEPQSHIVSYRRSLHEREDQPERITQHWEYQEAQTEELMMTSLKDSFQETSESERQAAISAQQSAISLQSEMSQATTACDSWKTKAIKLTKEVCGAKHEEESWRGNPRITHLVIYHHQE